MTVFHGPLIRLSLQLNEKIETSLLSLATAHTSSFAVETVHGTEEEGDHGHRSVGTMMSGIQRIPPEPIVMADVVLEMLRASRGMKTITRDSCGMKSRSTITVMMLLMYRPLAANDFV